MVATHLGCKDLWGKAVVFRWPFLLPGPHPRGCFFPVFLAFVTLVVTTLTLNIMLILPFLDCQPQAVSTDSLLCKTRTLLYVHKCPFQTSPFLFWRLPYSAVGHHCDLKWYTHTPISCSSSLVEYFNSPSGEMKTSFFCFPVPYFLAFAIFLWYCWDP